MEYTEKLLAINEKLDKNAEKIVQAKAKVTALEAERQRLEFSRKELMISDYLPIIEALSMSPSELKELLADYIGGDKMNASEVSDHE